MRRCVVVFECVVVGAGPAGLAASAALAGHGIDHVVLERARVGETWRTQRWESMRINNPGFMNAMLGEQDPDSYLTWREVVQRLDALGCKVPVRAGVEVRGMVRERDRWALDTNAGCLEARCVVVASGGENVPRRPALAAQLPGAIVQRHAAEYTKPGDLPDGGILVVGSAQSGTQIADELSAAGRPVWLSTSAVGRASARYRGRHTVRWLCEMGFFDDRTEDLPDPSSVRLVPALLAPGGRSMSLQTVAEHGATLTGRIVGVDGQRLTFDDSVAANVAYGDRAAETFRAMIDDHIRSRGLDAPDPEPDEANRPVRLDAPGELFLRDSGIRSVIWCTGLTGDFRWLGEELLDNTGVPRRQGPVSPAPGVWFLGLRWLLRRTSGNFWGFPQDAAVVADLVRNSLVAGTRRARPS